MLISLTLENWMSFRDQIQFSMVASKERQHGDRVPRLAKYQTKILPIAAIYGGNASGKTNLFRALNFAKRLVVNGTQPDALIPVDAFRLDAQVVDQPTRFCLELLINEVVYEFSFAVNRRVVLEEKLVEITGAREKVLYDRRDGKPHFDSTLAKNKFLEFAFQGTRDNQLFLTNAVSQKVEVFRPVYDWFKESLQLVAPDSRFFAFELLLDDVHPLVADMNGLLRLLDTGIVRLGGEEVPLDSLPLSEFLKSSLHDEIKEDTVAIVPSPDNERFLVMRKGAELTAKKLVAFHPKADGTEAKFDLRQESDGSQRVINLLPALLELSSHASKKVYVIDEIDRSLHTLLTRKLIDWYLGNCSAESRSQLLMTTHDVLLMDQQLLRRDEMWLTERDASGASRLISFSNYKDIRYDKDVRKSYLQGRMGGVPRILLGDLLSTSKNEKNAVED